MNCYFQSSFLDARKWLEEIKTRSPKDVSVILVGNKCDLLEAADHVVEYNTAKVTYNITIISMGRNVLYCKA